MAVIDNAQLLDILKTNPNKKLIQQARETSEKLSLHILGQNIDKALQQNTYFENNEVFAERNRKPTSNADLYARLLQREEMVFTAKGGAAYYTGLNEAQSRQLNAKLDNIRFNITIRKWIKEFALQAYRTDPMGVIFIETDLKANSYPTYKSSECIWDYLPNGRQLEYICFRLKPSEAKQFLLAAGLPVTDSNLNVTSTEYSPIYFRFVDDETDRILKFENNTVQILDETPISFESVPAIRASDIIDFTNNQKLLSPISKTVELAETFLIDRSVRDLSKKYSGFPKGYEPILTCATCNGTGYLSGKACPDCTQAGSDKGTGIKLRTKPADIARFPMPREGQTGNIDPSKFFGYVTPDIKTWDKQDTSLNDIEATMNDTYWGTTNKQSTTGPTSTDKHAFKETATKTLQDLQPIYARLNQTADWAESTENAIVDFIGKQMFPDNFKESSRTYGRYYILETSDELMEQYLDMKQKGAPQAQMFDTLRKYCHSVYANDPIQLAIKLKLINVEPFVHQSITQIEATDIARIDFLCKVYFSEWLTTLDDGYLLVTKPEDLIKALIAFVGTKTALAPELLIQPTVGITETIRNTN